MKLLVLSDSHRIMSYMYAAVEREQPDTIIHLGDHMDDAQRLGMRYPTLPLLSVGGNCDGGQLPLSRTPVIEGVRILMIHGHTLQVKYGLLRAELAAREAQAQVLLFGHTHRSMCECCNGLWMINPGSCGGYGPVTYGVLELSDGRISAEIRCLSFD